MRLIALLLASLILLPSQAKPRNEVTIRAEIHSRVAALWIARDFAGLDRLSAEFRKTRARTASGIWKLSVLNSALDEQIRTERRNGASWDDIHFAANRWASKSPTSPTAQLFVVRALTANAWAARGNEYARRVPPENMQAFRDLIARARRQLESIKSATSIDPGWYELMISNTTYGGRPNTETEHLFLEATSREPDYLQTYFVSTTPFGPKWGGSAEALEDFMKRAVLRLSPRAADAMYMRMAWWVLDLGFFEDPTGQSRLDCPRMMRGARTILKDFPDPWNSNNLVKFAAQCGDKESTAYFLSEMGSEPLKEAWEKHPPGYLTRLREFAKQ